MSCTCQWPVEYVTLLCLLVLYVFPIAFLQLTNFWISCSLLMFALSRCYRSAEIRLSLTHLLDYLILLPFMLSYEVGFSFTSGFFGGYPFRVLVYQLLYDLLILTALSTNLDGTFINQVKHLNHFLKKRFSIFFLSHILDCTVIKHTSTVTVFLFLLLMYQCTKVIIEMFYIVAALKCLFNDKLFQIFHVFCQFIVLIVVSVIILIVDS